MPRMYQQIDWSNGGDGIIARDSIKSISDLGQDRRASPELAVALLPAEHAAVERASSPRT
jgi:hypothetical protein